MDNKYYIVRGDRSGVFFGNIAERNGSEVRMTNVRCLWHWSGALSILELAKKGTENPRDCKFTASVDSITIIDAIELIPCTSEAAESIGGVAEWRA